MLPDKIPVSSYVATNSNTKLGDLALFCIPLFSRTNASALSLDLFCNNVIILMWLQGTVTNVHFTISCYLLGTSIYDVEIVQGTDCKGQLISKRLFGFFNSPKKSNEKFLAHLSWQKLTFSSSYFGRFKTLKFPFETLQ